MIESSLIAGTQPAGAGGAALGIAGALPVGSLGAAVANAGLAGGAAGDGFRERFEASVGLEVRVADTTVRTGGVGISSVGTGFSGRGLAVTDQSKRPVDSTGENGAVADPVLAAGDSEDVLDAASVGGPNVTDVTVAAGDGMGATESSVNGVVGTQWMGQHRNPVGAGQPQDQIDGTGAVPAEGMAGASKAILVSRPVMRQPEPRALPEDDRAAKDVVMSAPKHVEGAGDKPAMGAEPDFSKSGDSLHAKVSESAGSPVLLPPKGVLAVLDRAAIQGLRDAVVPGKDDAQPKGLASAAQSGPPPSVGVDTGSIVAVKTTGVLASVGKGLPSSVEAVPVTSDPVEDGTRVVTVPAIAAVLPGAAPVLTAATGKADGGTPAVEGKSGGLAARGNRKRMDAASTAAGLVPTTLTTAAATPLMTASAPGGAPVSDAALVASPLASPVASPVASAAAPMRMSSAKATPGDVRGLKNAVAANGPSKSDAFGTPVTGVGMSFGETAEAASSTRDLAPATPTAPATALAVAQDATPAKPQGVAARNQDVQNAAGFKGDTAQPVDAATETIDVAAAIRTAPETADFAGTIEALQPLSNAAPAVPATAAPARVGGPVKTAPAGRVSSVNAANADGPAVAVSALASASAAAPAVNERLTAAAAVGKGAGDSPVEAKATAAHVVPEAGQSLVAALVSPQVHTGIVADSKVPSADVPGATALRGAEFAGTARGENSLQHTTLVSTPNVLEVGVASGTNGWLKVRAEMDGSGGVAASVVATTASAAEALHKELPALSAYLRDESVGVSSLVVNRAEGGAMAQDATADLGSGAFGGGAQAGRGGQSGASDVQVQPEPLRDAVEPAMRSARFDGVGASAATAGYGRASGGWLNVVA